MSKRNKTLFDPVQGTFVKERFKKKPLLIWLMLFLHVFHLSPMSTAMETNEYTVVCQIISKLYHVISAPAPAGMSMCLSWCCPRPAWWVTWISSLSWMPTSSTFLRSRSLYWRTKHLGSAKSLVRSLLRDIFFIKSFNKCVPHHTLHMCVSVWKTGRICASISFIGFEYWTPLRV